MSRKNAKGLGPADFLVGLEMEFSSSLLSRMCGKPMDILRGIVRMRPPRVDGKPVDIGKIGIDGEFWELRTEPVEGHKIGEIVDRALDILGRFEARTSRECGLHINVSCKKRNLHDHLDPVKLWRNVRPAAISRQFGRTTDTWCVCPESDSLQSILRIYSLNVTGFRNAAVNFSKYHKRPKKSSRVEIRSAGGKGYHLRKALIHRTITQVVCAFSRSYEI